MYGSRHNICGRFGFASLIILVLDHVVQFSVITQIHAIDVNDTQKSDISRMDTGGDPDPALHPLEEHHGGLERRMNSDVSSGCSLSLTTNNNMVQLALVPTESLKLTRV